MKRTWELAFSAGAICYDIRPVIYVLMDFGWTVECASNDAEDGDYIYEVYDHDGDCMWHVDNDINIREALPHRMLRVLDARFGAKGKPQVIVGDAVKIPFPRSSNARS